MRLFAPLLLALVAACGVAAMGNRMHPRDAAWLSAAAVGTVFATVLASSWAVGLGFLAHAPLAGELFGWCREAFGADHPLPSWIAVPLLGVALWATVRAVRVVRLWRHSRGFDVGRVHVVPADRPLAFAETGREGGVVVTTAMLAALEPDECQALLAHERSHLRHRHDRFLLVASLAGGVGVLTPAVTGLRHALERWADEDAARELGNRSVVARAVARAALVAHDGPMPILGIVGADVPGRVAALMRPPIGRGMARTWAALAAAVMLAAVGSAVVQLHHLGAILAAICPG